MAVILDCRFEVLDYEVDGGFVLVRGFGCNFDDLLGLVLAEKASVNRVGVVLRDGGSAVYFVLVRVFRVGDYVVFKGRDFDVVEPPKSL